MLKLNQVSKRFDVGAMFASKTLTAVDNVSLDIKQGEFFSLVGESGCGKSTLARIVCGLEERSAGELVIDGQQVGAGKDFREKSLRRKVQMVFQDPYSSLNPRMTIRQILTEPLVSLGWGSPAEISRRLEELAGIIRFDAAALDRYPHQFSGGQRQRVAIARALATNPRLLICDEPVSALDVSIKGQIINLLLDVQQQLGVTILFISHDLSLVEKISDRVGVMYLGSLVEVGPARELFDNPRHHYTRLLIDSIPSADPSRKRGEPLAAGEVPSPFSIPSGCRFRDRCPASVARCAEEAPHPQFVPGEPEHWASCHVPVEHAIRLVAPKRVRPAGMALYETL